MNINEIIIEGKLENGSNLFVSESQMDNQIRRDLWMTIKDIIKWGVLFSLEMSGKTLFVANVFFPSWKGNW